MIQMQVKKIRLDLGKYWPCIPSTEGTMWDPYAFPKEANRSHALLETGTAPGLLLFLWKQTPTLFTKERESLKMHELRG